jgi:hypothetical protein
MAATLSAARTAVAKLLDASGSIPTARAANRGPESGRGIGFFVNGDRSLPDINRLFAECVWNPDLQRWEPTRRDGDTVH